MLEFRKKKRTVARRLSDEARNDSWLSRMMLQKRVFEALEGSEQRGAARVWHVFMFALIALNATAVVLSTVSSFNSEFGLGLQRFEAFSVTIFAIEYVARIWAVGASTKYAGRFWGRARFAATPLALIDLAAILPALLALSTDLRVLRILRFARVARVMKLARYSRAIALVGRVVRRTKEPLIVAALAVFGLILTAASLMYYAERNAQPEAFSSIPAAMWWAVSTVTTVGYGDVYPVTNFGRLLGAIIAVTGIASFAFPTAILGAGFLAEVRSEQEQLCPRCGANLQRDSGQSATDSISLRKP